MSDSMNQQLIGHLLCALDDEEQEWIDERLDHDELCSRELRRWQRRLGCLEALRPEFEPPPGLADRTCRMVAAFGPAPTKAPLPRVTMTPDPSLAGESSGIGWHDVIALGVLMLTALALLGPAIDSGRFNAGLASCQNDMRRFGMALTQYGEQHGETITELADGGKLTAAGLAAADLLAGAAESTNQKHLCPETWLAAQGTIRLPSSSDGNSVVPPTPGTSVPGDSFYSADICACDYYSPENDWSGAWRTGTLDGHGNRLPADTAILADDPSVDLPGLRPRGHRGRGRNLLFRNGRVTFVPCTTADEPFDPVFCDVESSPSSDVSAPIIYVNRR